MHNDATSLCPNDEDYIIFLLYSVTDVIDNNGQRHISLILILCLDLKRHQTSTIMADIERSVEDAAAIDLNKSADTESQTSEIEHDFNVNDVVGDFARLFAVDPTSQVRFLSVFIW